MCQRWSVSASTKPNMIRALEKVLSDPLHVESMARGLPEDAIRLLHLNADTGTMSCNDALHVPGLYSSQASRQALDEVVTLGLALVCPHEQSGAFHFSHLHMEREPGEPSPTLFVPDAVHEGLPKAKPLGIQVPAVDAPPKESIAPASDSDRATAFILETLRIIELLNPRVTAADALHKADLARAQELAREAELPVDGFSLSLMVAQELGCVEVRRGRLVTTPLAGEWANKPYPERMRDVLNAYLIGQSLPDTRLFFPQLFEALDERLPRGSVRRTYHRLMVAKVLSEQAEEVWHSVDAFVAALYRLDRNVLCLEERWRAVKANALQVSASWYDHQWQMREHRLFCWMIQNMLRDLGVVRLTSDGKYFQVTPTGRYALGVGPRPDRDADAQQDALIVQANFEIVVYQDRCPPTLRRILDTFCERVQGGMVSTYRLTQESVYRGGQTGLPLAEFLNLLDANSKVRIPENVRDQFVSWERKLETVLIYGNAEVIECINKAEADRVAGECENAKRIGERFVICSGKLPSVDVVVDYRQVRRPCVLQEEGLAVRVPWERADLFVRRAIERLGDISEAKSGDMLAHLSKKRILEGRDWPDALEDLAALCVEPLAGRYKVAVRAWSGDSETAASKTVTVVRFADAETCEGVLEFPDVAGHVEGRLGPYTLILKQGELGAFKKKLKQRGIIVKPSEKVADPPGEIYSRNGAAAQAPAPPADGEPAPEDEGEHEEEAAVAGKRRRRKNGAKPGPKNGRRRKHSEPPPAAPRPRLPAYSARITREILEDAIARRRPVLVEYQNAWSTEPTVRRIDPVALDANSSSPSLSGYCHLHQGARTFKLARVMGIRVLEDENF